MAALSAVLLYAQTLPWPQSICALAIIWVAALPALLYLQGLDLSPAPFLPAVGVFYIVFFGLPAFMSPLAVLHGERILIYHRFVLDTIGSDVLLLVAAGISAMFSAHYAVKKLISVRISGVEFKLAPPPPKILALLYGILLVSSLSYRYSDTLHSLPSIGQFLDPASYLAWGGYYLLWRRGQLPTWMAYLLLVIFAPLEIYIRVRLLFLTDLLFLPMFFFFLCWRERQFRLVGIFVAIGVLIAASYTATGGARSLAPTFGGKIAAVFDYVRDTLAKPQRVAMTKPVPDTYDYSLDPRFSRMVNRIAHIWVFQTVYERSPDPIPYWGGETYRPLWTASIPRILYPNKPEERAGGLFGQRYGFSDGIGDPSSYNIPWITELLANYGPWGVVLGMAVFGLLLGALDKVFNANGMNDLEFLIGLTVIFRLTYQESNFSVMSGSLLLLFGCLYLYFRFGAVTLERLAGQWAR